MTATPEPPYWYDNMSLEDQEEVSMLFSMWDSVDDILLGSFTSHTWFPGIFTTDIFWDADNHAGIFWSGTEDIYGLWMHSGTDRPAYPLQEYIEKDENGITRTVAQVDEFIENRLIGAEVRIKKGDTLSVNRVVAAVRIGTDGVLEIVPHVWDLAQYLGENYPGHGFERLENPSLIMYFCGRRLTGEPDEPQLTYWQKARFVIGVVPYEEAHKFLDPDIYTTEPVSGWSE
jgi:hypothetical protein